ncbi:trehalose-phosphatase, partial [Geminicoccus harenae]
MIQPAANLPTIPLSQMALFLDVDGTLLDIAPTPDAVVVSDELKAVLAGLFAGAGGAVALVSGRTVADLDRLFQPLRLPVAGQHGAEWRITADGITGRI